MPQDRCPEPCRFEGEEQEGNERHSAGAAMLLAAVADPSYPALLIDSDNKGAGWVPVSGAAGRCAAVVVSPTVLAVDLDDPATAFRLTSDIVEAAERLGLEPVVLASGAPGHRHIWVQCHDVTVRDELAVTAALHAASHGVAYPVRSGEGGRMRPPLAPHRSGATPELLSHSAAADAARALTSSKPSKPRHPPPHRVPPKRSHGHTAAGFRDRVAQKHGETDARVVFARLSPTCRQLLLDGDEIDEPRYPKAGGRGPDRSVVTRVVALGVRRAGGSVEALAALLDDPCHAAGKRWREEVAHNPRRAWSWLRRVWPTVLPDTGPAPEERSAAPAPPSALVEEVIAALIPVAESWTHRYAPNDRLVLDVFFARARRQGTTRPHAAERALAAESGLSRTGVRGALSRLTDSGVLVSRGRRMEDPGLDVGPGTVWELVVPASTCTDASSNTTAVRPSRRDLSVSSSVVICRQWVSGSDELRDAAAALGPRAVEVATLLRSQGPLSADDVASRVGIRQTRSLTRRPGPHHKHGGALWRLLAAGWVTRNTAGLYEFLEPASEALEAAVRGAERRRPGRALAGRSARLRALYAAESAAYAEWRRDTIAQRRCRAQAAVEAWYRPRRGPAAAQRIAARWAYRQGFTAEPADDRQRRAARANQLELLAVRRSHSRHRPRQRRPEVVSEHRGPPGGGVLVGDVVRPVLLSLFGPERFDELFANENLVEEVE